MPSAAPIHRPAVSAARTHSLEEDRQSYRALATNSAEWRRRRAAHLMSEPLCRHCAAEGIVTAANEVDHIDEDATNDDPSNYQSLCKPHHSMKTARNRAKGRGGEKLAS